MRIEVSRTRETLRMTEGAGRQASSMQNLTRKCHVGDFGLRIRRLSREHHRRLHGSAWDSVDNRFGELRYDNLFWHNALKDLGMASIRSLGWNVGTIREMFGVPGAQLRQMGLTGAGGGFGKPPIRMVNTGTGPGGHPRYEAQPESRLSRKLAWFVSMVLVYGLAGAIYQYLHTRKRPESLTDYFFPLNGETRSDGRPQRVSIPGYFKDLYAVMHALPGSAVETAKRKLHPLLTLLADTWANEDFYGTEIRNADDPWVQQLAEVLRFAIGEAQPISFRAGGVEQKFGVTAAPASVGRTALERYLHDIAPPTHRTQEEAARATTRRDVRTALRAGNPEAAKAAAAAGGVVGRSLGATARSAALTPLQGQFQHTTLEQALRGYTLASPAERAQLRPFLGRKLGPALAQMPPAERTTLLERYRAAMRLPVANVPKKAANF
jgi:hypothetical protein